MGVPKSDSQEGSSREVWGTTEGTSRERSPGRDTVREGGAGGGHVAAAP